jgi:hypothetical protein
VGKLFAIVAGFLEENGVFVIGGIVLSVIVNGSCAIESTRTGDS